MVEKSQKNLLEKNNKKINANKEVEKKIAESKNEASALGEKVGVTAETKREMQDVVGKFKLANVQNEDVRDLSKWRTGKGKYEEITTNDVIDIVNKLEDPYNKDISEFIKKGDIEGMQKYLNGKIDGGEIDKSELSQYLQGKKIRFNGHILEDGKFGPQTLYTMMFIVKKQKEEKKESGQQSEKPVEQVEQIKGNLDWIIQEMADEISGVVDTDPSKRWAAERGVLDTENFKVDTRNKTITIETRGTSLNSPERAYNPKNRCEYNWATGQIFAYVGDRRYTMPMKLQGLRLDSAGLPDGNQRRNRDVVEAFARVGNLMNNLKAHGVYNQKGALEEENGGIEVNNSEFFGHRDTQLISKSALDNLRGKYSHIGLDFETVELAGMLTAMKLDLGKIKWDPDIERVGVDPLDDDHKAYVKRYSQTYGR